MTVLVDEIDVRQLAVGQPVRIRVDALPEIAAQFRALVNAQGGSSDAVVFSAFAIDDKALAELTVVLEKRFGRKLNVTMQLDASLIGGVRVVVGDEVLDTSVKARLDQMKVALTASPRVWQSRAGPHPFT